MQNAFFALFLQVFTAGAVYIGFKLGKDYEMHKNAQKLNSHTMSAHLQNHINEENKENIHD